MPTCSCECVAKAIAAIQERLDKVEIRLDVRDQADVDKEEREYEEYMGNDL